MLSNRKVKANCVTSSLLDYTYNITHHFDFFLIIPCFLFVVIRNRKL